MKRRGSRRPGNVEHDPAALAEVERARAALAEKLRAGPLTTKELGALFSAVDRLAETAGWDRPEIREQIRTGRYHAPGFVIDDEYGYDRELAKRSVGPGWGSLIDEAFEVRDRKFPDARFVQVKEKFGGLVMYVEGPGDQVRFADVVEDLRRRSLLVCERCGRPGVLRRDYWLKTLCDQHAEGRPPFARSGPSA